MKRTISAIALSLVLFALLPLQARAAELLIPVGKIIGLQLRDDTVTVAAYDDALGNNAKNAGLKIGDEIVKIDSTDISCADDVRTALNHCGSEVELTVRRGSKLSILHLTPEQSADGPRLGIYLRQGIAGIGTVTFYDPETGKFGTLGHGVSGSKGDLLQMTQGYAYEAQILSVKKGKSGDTAQEYSVEILKIYPEDRSDGRNFLIKVTDPTLLSVTGGIVQGMSGSPIIQDGKLIGAVTHVLVNDPSTGYGIFIEKMLDAAA